MAVTNYMEKIAATELAKRPIQSGIAATAPAPGIHFNPEATEEYVFHRFGGPLITSPLAIMTGMKPIPAPPKPAPLRPYNEDVANEYLGRRFGSDLPTSTLSIMGGLRRPYQPDGTLAPPTTGLASSMENGAMGMVKDSVGNIGASIGGLVRAGDVLLHGKNATAPIMRDYFTAPPPNVGVRAPIYPQPPGNQGVNSGLRPDGAPKGLGYFGPIQRPDGKISTELTIGLPINGRQMDVPMLVPTLTREEMDHLLSGGTPTLEIAQKAGRFALERLRAGKSIFAEPGEEGQTPIPEAFRRHGLEMQVQPGTGYVETGSGRTHLDGHQEGTPSHYGLTPTSMAGPAPEAPGAPGNLPQGVLGVGSSISEVNRLIGQPQWVVEGPNGDRHLGFGDRTKIIVRDGRIAGIQYANPEQAIATGQKYAPDEMETAEWNAAIDRANPEAARYRRDAGLRRIEGESAAARQALELASKERQVKMESESKVNAAQAGGHYERNETGELVYMPGKVSGLQREGGTVADAKAYELTAGEFKAELEDLNLQLKEAMKTGFRTDPAEQAIIDRLSEQIIAVKAARKDYIRRLSGVGLRGGANAAAEIELPAPDGIARPRTQREYDLLPIGTPYIDPVSGTPTRKQAKQR
jgi:hypothetical protein